MDLNDVIEIIECKRYMHKYARTHTHHMYGLAFVGTVAVRDPKIKNTHEDITHFGCTPRVRERESFINLPFRLSSLLAALHVLNACMKMIIIGVLNMIPSSIEFLFIFQSTIFILLLPPNHQFSSNIITTHKNWLQRTNERTQRCTTHSNSLFEECTGPCHVSINWDSTFSGEIPLELVICQPLSICNVFVFHSNFLGINQKLFVQECVCVCKLIENPNQLLKFAMPYEIIV